MRISDWSSDVCSSDLDAAEDVDENALHGRIAQDDLERRRHLLLGSAAAHVEEVGREGAVQLDDVHRRHGEARAVHHAADIPVELDIGEIVLGGFDLHRRSEEHTSELQSLMRISYAVFCLKKKKKTY